LSTFKTAFYTILTTRESWVWEVGAGGKDYDQMRYEFIEGQSCLDGSNGLLLLLILIIFFFCYSDGCTFTLQHLPPLKRASINPALSVNESNIFSPGHWDPEAPPTAHAGI